MSEFSWVEWLQAEKERLAWSREAQKDSKERLIYACLLELGAIDPEEEARQKALHQAPRKASA